MNTLKRFIHYYKPYQALFYLDLICAAVISMIDLLYPQILRSLTNTLFAGDPHLLLKALVPIGIGLFIMYIIQSLCKFYVCYQGHMMGANMERDMRQQLFDHYEKLSFSYYDRNNFGQMMSKLVSDLFDIAEFAHHGPENLFISLIKIVGSFIFLFLISWQLALPLAFLVVCMLVFSLAQNGRMQTTFMDNRKRIGDVNASLQDTLAGIRVVQSFVLPLHMMLDFRLCIPDYVITVCMNAADPMHDKLSARPLVKYDITFPKFPRRRSEENTVASMNQKRRHAAPGNHHTHFSALLYKFFQHSDIGTCIHHFHACFSLF